MTHYFKQKIILYSHTVYSVHKNIESTTNRCVYFLENNTIVNVVNDIVYYVTVK